MTLAAESFGWAFVTALGALATQIAAVVEKELHQREVVIAEVTAQEKIAAEAAVEVLDEGTGPTTPRSGL
jgi:hypothetical protein